MHVLRTPKCSQLIQKDYWHRSPKACEHFFFSLDKMQISRQTSNETHDKNKPIKMERINAQKRLCNVYMFCSGRICSNMSTILNLWPLALSELKYNNNKKYKKPNKEMDETNQNRTKERTRRKQQRKNGITNNENRQPKKKKLNATTNGSVCSFPVLHVARVRWCIFHFSTAESSSQAQTHTHTQHTTQAKHESGTHAQCTDRGSSSSSSI